MQFAVPISEIFFDVSCGDARNIIRECITPDVHDVFWVVWDWDSPGELFFCTREADIFETVTDHYNHLILSEFWGDFDVTIHEFFFNSIAVFAEFEEIVLIFCPACRSTAFFEAFILIKFLLRYKSFFSVTVPTGILFLIDISVIEESHP